MPTYVYRCIEGHTTEVVRRIADMRQWERCLHPGCLQDAPKVIVPVLVSADLPGYNCPITNQWIAGSRAHRENLKRHSCRVYEPGETKSFIKSRDARDKAAAAQVDRAVEAAARDMGLIPR